MTIGLTLADERRILAPSQPTREDLIKAIKRLRNAETEYHRAIAASEQPRLSKAGTRYQAAKWNCYKVAGLK